MKLRRWFLPETPDLIGRLRDQAAIVLEGMDAFAAWAAGDKSAGKGLLEIEHRGDAAKRELIAELRDAFVTPLGPEDLFALSRGIDWILDYARDLVSEAQAMGSEPDPRLGEMAASLREAVARIDEALGHLDSDANATSTAADAAIAAERAMEHTYFTAMAESLEVDSRQARITNRELYRRCARIGDEIVDVAERIIYAVVKES